MTYDDTIFAPATVPGRSAIAIVRISGPSARETGGILGFALPAHRVAQVRSLRDGGRKLDQAIVLFRQAPRSFSGEDMVELHLHGGIAVRDGVLSALARHPGFRFADPGEFSRRAVLNGKMDLTSAEAMNDLISAETEAQREQAVWQLEGGLARQFDGWMSTLTRSRAHLEAWIDFPDEDIPGTIERAIAEELAVLRTEITGFLDDNRRGERLREGLRMAIVGPPNVGKSSLVNWLSRRDASIVTEQAGTTRDIVEVHLDLGGYPVIVADTAGIHAGGDRIERIGMERAVAWARAADLTILVLDATAPANRSRDSVGSADLVLLNKVDLKPEGWPGERGKISMSLRSGVGLDRVLETLQDLARRTLDVRAGPCVTRARHRAALEDAKTGIGSALDALQDHAGAEIVAENLRFAGVSIGRITGAVRVEELLDVVFRDFCIGK